MTFVNGNENNVDFQNDNNIKRNDFSQQFIKARTFLRKRKNDVNVIPKTISWCLANRTIRCVCQWSRARCRIRSKQIVEHVHQHNPQQQKHLATPTDTLDY